ncbi:superoxide dismutase [Nakamurella deserti]|uniref:superoxide dismutase n=1 Tax=Nakamurella deserti TaxID=2164074 RepID=UPI000DBE07E5|nr:superoxide dismutase [Nakamurella deserti]
MSVRLSRVLVATLLALGVGVAAAPAAAAHPGGGGSGPARIELPAGFQPEGISSAGSVFFVGSRTDGAIYRGSLRTGEGAVLVPGTPGGFAAGTEVDRAGRLWVAGGATGTGTVYDTRTGARLARFDFDTSGAAFINDVVVTRNAAYYTDSRHPVLYVVPLGRHGSVGEVTALPLTGAVQVVPGATNLNGIETTPDGRRLLAVQSNTGLLFAVDPSTGVTTQVDLGGVGVANGDGLLRDGRTLYVVQNRLNTIAAFDLDKTGTRGTLRELITSGDFDIPTTVTGSGRYLFAVNARFGTADPLTAAYWITRVPR